MGGRLHELPWCMRASAVSAAPALTVDCSQGLAAEARAVNCIQGLAAMHLRHALHDSDRACAHSVSIRARWHPRPRPAHKHLHLDRVAVWLLCAGLP